MLDQDLLAQLKSLFAALEGEVALVYEPTSHQDLSSLTEMLEAVASTSDKVSVRREAPADGKQARMPLFHIYFNGAKTGVTFKGIPSGHEFSSLVLAILNVDSKGKLPDKLLIQRIKKIKGPIDIKTYISLTCENCPDVVQALNQMAFLHGNFRHEMIDGAYAQDEIEQLKIQGVPSIVVNNKMIHSGRITLLELITKLESVFGVSEGESVVVDADLGHFDTLVIGGGPAGVSASIYSVRKGLRTALITEKIGGQVQETKGIENLISVPYTEGPQLAAQLSQHVSSYPVQIFENRRVKSIEDVPGHKSRKAIHLESGERLMADAVIVATGAKWRELNVPGEKDYLGRGVAFCPHCDGPFYKGKKVAVVGGGNSGVEAAIDLAGIVGEVVLFEYNQELKADKILVDKLLSLKNVKVVTNAKTAEIKGNGEKVTSLEYFDREYEVAKSEPLDGVFIQIGLVPNSQFLKGVVELSKYGEVVIDNKGRTSAPGIYAAGDVTTTPYKQIIIAMGEGARAALAAFEDKAFAT